METPPEVFERLFPGTRKLSLQIIDKVRHGREISDM